ncbi:hypothetical protein AAMO2058_000695700 [Amorphochlora amoebiformis]
MVQGKVSKVTALLSIGLMPLTFGTAFGFAFGNIGGAMSCDAFNIFYKSPDNEMQQLIAAMLPMGAILGSLCGGTFADKYGRNAASLFASVLFVCGSVVLGMPLINIESLAPLLIGRGMIGAGAGIAFMSVPAYVCELSAPSYRGAMASSISLAIALGFFCSYLCNWLVLTDYEEGWKWSMVVPLFPSLLFFLASSILPKSPRWAILNGAGPSVPIGILQRLRTPEDDVSKEVAEIIEDVRASKQYGSVFSPTYRLASIISITVMMLQVATGIDIILVYAPQNFAKLIPSQSTKLFWTILIGGVLVLSNCVACYVVDFIGRRALLLCGSAGMSLSLIGAAMSFHLKEMSVSDVETASGMGLAGVGCIACSMLYVMFFSLSWGPVAFCIPSELVPSHIRARVVALAAVCNWVADYVVVASYLSVVSLVAEPGAFLIYAMINIFALGFVWKYIPETKDMSLEDASRRLISQKDFDTI